MSVYKFEKNKTWCFQFFVQTKGVRKCYKGRGFASKKDAEKAERIRRMEVDSEKIQVEEDGLTAKGLASSFLDNERTKVKKATYLVTERLLRNYILPFFGDINIYNLDKKIINEWRMNVFNLQVSVGHKNKIIAVMKKLLTYAAIYDPIDAKLFSVLEPFKEFKKIKTGDYWTKEEFDKFINTYQDGQMKTFFITLFYSGMRIGEIRAITRKDLDNNCINVNKAVTSKNKVIDEVSTPKSSTSVRKISMPDWIMELLQIEANKKNKFIFTDEHTKNILTENKIRNSMDKHIELAGVKKIRIHDVRHSHASYLINSGVPIKAVSLRLGHSSVKITMDTYWHLLEKTDDDIIKLLK